MQEGMIVTDRWRPTMKTKLVARRRSRTYAATALAIAIAGLNISLTSPAQAQATSPLVTNGGFQTLITVPQGNGLGSVTAGTPTVFGNLCGDGVLVASSICPTQSPVVGWTAKGLVAVFTPLAASPSGTSADSIGAQFKTFSPCTSVNPTAPPGSFGAPCSTPGESEARAKADGAFRLWGPGNTGNDINYNGNCPGCVRFGKPGTTPPPDNNLSNCNISPDCGSNFIALDGDFHSFTTTPDHTSFQGQIDQSISGLIPGRKYEISFFWAGAQQTPRSLPSGVSMLNYQLLVGLVPPGGSAGDNAGPNDDTLPTPGPSGTGFGVYTNIIHAPNHGFSGWNEGEVTIEATKANETLSFLALGTPSGGALPPIVLLDGVSMRVVPEPGTWSLLGIGFAAIVGVAYRRRKWLNLPGQAGVV
jgi:hypothetical protein